jgi:hypothetical protein
LPKMRTIRTRRDYRLVERFGRRKGNIIFSKYAIQIVDYKPRFIDDLAALSNKYMQLLLYI